MNYELNMKGHTFKDWFLATRPWSFPASTMPVLVAMMFLWATGRDVAWGLGIMALVNIVLVHAAGNVWSDYHDYKQGVDAPDTYGVRILTDKKFTPEEVLGLSISLQVVAVLMGLLMVYLTDITLLWFGMAGIALSLLYPPLKYAALGDLVIMACYALLPMLGTTFICTGNVVTEVLWLAVPVGSITVAILHANNARDIETDRRANIRTFALLTGRPFAINVYPIVCQFLCDDLKLFRSLTDQVTNFIKNLLHRSTLMFPSNNGNGTIGAMAVTPLGYLKIGIVAWRGNMTMKMFNLILNLRMIQLI